MNIRNRILLTALLVVAAVASVMAKGVVTKVYVYGFAASFNDSIVHFTDIQEVDSAWTDPKTKFLLGRDSYSYQLRDYLATKQSLPNRTCIVVYNTDRSKLEKDFLKMRRLYTEKKAKGKFEIHDLKAADFKFEAVNADYGQEDVATVEAKPKSKEKKDKRHPKPRK